MSEEVSALEDRVALLERVVLAIVEMPVVSLSASVMTLMPELGFDYVITPDRGGVWQRRPTITHPE